jgi:hypothetical protein
MSQRSPHGSEARTWAVRRPTHFIELVRTAVLLVVDEHGQRFARCIVPDDLILLHPHFTIGLLLIQFSRKRPSLRDSHRGISAAIRDGWRADRDTKADVIH